MENQTRTRRSEPIWIIDVQDKYRSKCVTWIEKVQSLTSGWAHAQILSSYESFAESGAPCSAFADQRETIGR